jgi:hypothetical protein
MMAMGKPTGFMEFGRELPRRRPVKVRLRDWREVYEPFSAEQTQEQGARCMDCGIPFCHEGCPLGNLIPEWNDLVYRDDWSDAIERLHATNNFPEFTGRLCPAPCEAACVLGINEDPVTIERIEYEIVERAWSEGWVGPQLATSATGKSVAVVGSGPAGLAAAQQLARAGHAVTVFERAEKPGGLLRYGIPEFKMEKAVLDRRLAQLESEGVVFVCSTSVGVTPDRMAEAFEPVEPGQERGLGRASAADVVVRSAADIRAEFDAVVLAGGATLPRDLPVPGRELAGVHLAMEYLKPSNLVQEGALNVSPISAKLDYSKHRVTDETLSLLFAWPGRRRRGPARRHVRRRAHQLHRGPGRAARGAAHARGRPLIVDGQDVVADVHAVLRRMGDLSDRIRDGRLGGGDGQRIRAVVNIGIGGSDLGPAMATEALADYASPDLISRFVSNVDPVDLYAATHDLDPATTLFVVSSKTFTTLETLTNAAAARTWLLNGLADAAGPGGRSIRRGGQALHRRVDQRQGRGRVRHRHRQHARVLGLGRRPLLLRLGHRLLAHGGHRPGGLRRHAGRLPRHRRALPHGAAGPEPAGHWGCSTSGTTTSSAPRPMPCCPTATAWPVSRPTCSS